MNKVRVLLAEDELSLAHIVRESLEHTGFAVTLCQNGEQALQKYREVTPDILALDVMMPKIDGFEVARRIRETDKRTPIIFLTARSQPRDVVAGFELGANDYLKKPFSVEELIIRIKVLLSEGRLLKQLPSTKPKSQLYHLGTITFDPSRNCLRQDQSNRQLTARESEVLLMLCKQGHETLPRTKLLQNIWGDDNFFNARSLDVFITKLRKHLESDPSVQIINIRGVGYKLVW